MFKYCIPKVTGRGAGLGNELIPWAKACIASAELGIPFGHPAWGLNRQRYWEYFGTSRLDWVGHYLLSKTLPSYIFTEADYYATGEKDFGRAIEVYAEANGLRSKEAYVLWVEGMWGGYYALGKAKSFVLSILYGSNYTVANLFDLKKKIRVDSLVVAVHIRLGDFVVPSESRDYRGKSNVSIPLSWYVAVSRAIKKAFGDSVQFVLLTNGNPFELHEYIREFDPIMTAHQDHTVCSDLLAMVNADLLVCSISSYSMWAAFLSEEPYIWYEPHLQSHERCFSLCGHEARQQPPDGVTAENISQFYSSSHDQAEASMLPRGIPVGDDAQIPTKIVTYLKSKLWLKAARFDLVRYGLVPKIADYRPTLKLVQRPANGED